jgi:predicted N-acetyltransferase YhbS
MLMASGGNMLIRVEKAEDVAALERVRRAAGDRSGVAAVVRLIREADAGERALHETSANKSARDAGPKRTRKGAKS